MKSLALTLAILLPLGIIAKPQLEEVLGPSSGLTSPFGVTFDKKGNAYIAEYEGGRILNSIRTANSSHSPVTDPSYRETALTRNKGYFLLCGMGYKRCAHVWTLTTIWCVKSTAKKSCPLLRGLEKRLSGDGHLRVKQSWTHRFPSA